MGSRVAGPVGIIGAAGILAAAGNLFGMLDQPDFLLALVIAIRSHGSIDPQSTFVKLGAGVLELVGAVVLTALSAWLSHSPLEQKPDTITTTLTTTDTTKEIK